MTTSMANIWECVHLGVEDEDPPIFSVAVSIFNLECSVYPVNMAPDGIARRAECVEQVADGIVSLVFLEREFRVGPYLWLLGRCISGNLNKALTWWFMPCSLSSYFRIASCALLM